MDSEINQSGRKIVRFNFIEGMTPSEIATIAHFTMAKLRVSNDYEISAEAYWHKLSAKVIKQAAHLARAFSMTDEGGNHEEETGESPYSLNFIYAIIRNTELRKNVGDTVYRVLDSIGKRKITDSLNPVELYGLMTALHFMDVIRFDPEDQTFDEMSDGQKRGVAGAVDKLFLFERFD